MSPDSPPSSTIRPPHPLALELIARLHARPSCVLEVGAGSGRNTHALRRAGLAVTTLEQSERCDGALSTHALLHGTPADISALCRAIAARLHPLAPFYATFGSIHDARFGAGARLGDATFAPIDGDEAGVAHTYFDEPALRRMLESDFAIESLEERGVDAIAGNWAHERRPLRGAVHWFARVHRLR